MGRGDGAERRGALRAHILRDAGEAEHGVRGEHRLRHPVSRRRAAVRRTVRCSCCATSTALVQLFRHPGNCLDARPRRFREDLTFYASAWAVERWANDMFRTSEVAVPQGLDGEQRRPASRISRRARASPGSRCSANGRSRCTSTTCPASRRRTRILRFPSWKFRTFCGDVHRARPVRESGEPDAAVLRGHAAAASRDVRKFQREHRDAVGRGVLDIRFVGHCSRRSS